VGSSLVVPAELAALVNGTLGHALDYDDVLPGTGHASSLLLAAILAVGGERPLTGEQLLEAYVVGHESHIRTAKALGPRHYRKGWHITSTAGTFGATAAVAKLAGLDVDATRVALGIAGSMASGLQRNFGTMTKPLHSGLAARNGVLAVQLAQAGLSAASDVLDGPKGYLDLAGEGVERPAAYDLLGNPWALMDPGVSLKKYPCCYEVARSSDAMLQIRSEYGFAPEQVEKIYCRVPTDGLSPLIYSRPGTGLEAKFSMEYTLGAALIDGGLTLSSFTDEAVRRPQVRALMERVQAWEDPMCRPEDPDNLVSSAGSGGFVEVTVQAGGVEAMAQVRSPSGSPDLPLTWAEIEEKYLACVREGGGDQARAAELFPRLREIEKEPDVHGLLDELTSR
jgi:2-methylcitrate dehydratase PrpD